MTLFHFILSFALAGAVAAIGRRLGWLSGKGAVAALVVGAAIFAAARLPGAMLLLAFFISGSLLTKLTAKARAPSRTARQILANGLVPAVAALGIGVDGLDWMARLGMAGALAAATADTWATELGTWMGKQPRSALTGRFVERGASGGVTVAGTFGGMAGAMLIAGVALAAWPDFGVQEALTIEAAGFAAMWVDSLLGASAQFQGYCPACSRTVEDPNHAHDLQGVRGWPFVDNDAVNFAATLFGAAFALLAGAMG